LWLLLFSWHWIAIYFLFGGLASISTDLWKCFAYSQCLVDSGSLYILVIYWDSVEVSFTHEMYMLSTTPLYDSHEKEVCFIRHIWDFSKHLYNLSRLLFFSFFFFFAVLVFELKASSLLGRCYTTGSTLQPFFVLGIFKIRSSKLFAQVSFKL
jgi:hypothetical protein